MNYEQALEYIHSTPKFSRVLGNSLLKKLLSCLGNPQNNLKFVHIAGTNGKGSTAAMTAQILKKSGLKTGLFTSPFIERFNERIQINNEPISDNDLTALTELIKNTIEKNDTPVSEFALITAIAFLYFNKENCDIVILETGMGGRLDATNVIENPLVCAITSISLDHTEYLGDTLEKIATEKCGIIKENSPVILYPIQDTTVFDTVKKYCDKNSSKLIIPHLSSIKNSGFVYDGESYTLSLKASYQIYNACVVIEIIKVLRSLGFYITGEDLKYGLSHTQWIARFEFLTKDLIIDGGHNIGGISELTDDLLKLNKTITIVTAWMKDKNYTECIKKLSEISDCIIVTELNMPRCCEAEIIAEEFKKLGITPKIIKNPKDAVNTALSFGNITCVCGSLYLAGEVRRNFSSSDIQ